MTARLNLVTLVVAGLLTITGCVSLDPEAYRMNNQSQRNADRSSADLLVPVDDEFRNTWKFHVLDSPNNYTFFSNFSVRYDSSVDQELMTAGYLVNDSSTWTGGQIHGRGETVKAIYTSALADSWNVAESIECEWVDLALAISRCHYLADHGLSPFEIYIRHFDDPASALVMADDNDVALRYLSGEFDLVSFEEASERWLVDPR